MSHNNLDLDLNNLIKKLHDVRSNGGKVVFVSGKFNVIHPGHQRLLNFAADCGETLVVGISSDANPGILISEKLRMEAVSGLENVDHVIVVRTSVTDTIEKLRPDIVVKGKEHESSFNEEELALQTYGGKLLFSSGDVRFSSMDLLRRELQELNLSTIVKPKEFINRHNLSTSRMVELTQAFSYLKVVVVGDLIVDEYVTCDPLGMSQEDPTIVVTPIKSDLFIGGAAIVASHAKGMNASVKYFGVAGVDEASVWASEKLAAHGVKACIFADESRPTTLKQRYRARGKTLLRVSHLRQHSISRELAERMFDSMLPAIEEADVLIFSDFSYGCLPQGLVDKLIDHGQRHDVLMVADSQSSSQMGDVSRFKGMKLITPTEHEARIAGHTQESGLVALTEALMTKANAEHVLITLGAEGVFIHSPNEAGSGVITDQLPAFNHSPKDVSGAGDSLLMSAAMALAVGATIWEAAFIGSVAAACQVGRVGNLPLSLEEVLKELQL